MGKLALIICTKDRPVDLTSLLKSIAEQTLLPDSIIIIDGSDNAPPVKEVCDQFHSSLPITYKTLRPPGLTRQRNLGISLLSSETTWVGFLDDDLVLEPVAIQEMKTFLETKPQYKGVGLVINNQDNKKPSFLRNLFFLDKMPGGQVTASGLPASIRPVQTSMDVEWIYGGATFWHTEILKKYKFDEWFSGVGYLEDVDFSYHVSRSYPLAINGKARCWHYHHPAKKENMIKYGTWQIVSWWYFISKYQRFNRLLVLWSMSAVTLANLVAGLRNKKTYRERMFLGNIIGFWKIVTNQTQTHKGFQK
ncbi:MAG: hypothetical protein CME71_12780 [Halobacteriovorax sp.]|nr:hypothetical protein [Halobacteriovorax sp.]